MSSSQKEKKLMLKKERLRILMEQQLIAIRGGCGKCVDTETCPDACAN
jgi:hypothetical protein